MVPVTNTTRPMQSSTSALPTPTSRRTTAATNPAMTGFRKFRLRLSADARRQAMRGPTPISRRSPRKIGMFTRLKNGAPTESLTPRRASDRRGKIVPKNTVNAAATRNTLLRRNTDSREGIESPCEQRERRQEHQGQEPEKELTDGALGESVHRPDDPGAREERAEDR